MSFLSQEKSRKKLCPNAAAEVKLFQSKEELIKEVGDDRKACDTKSLTSSEPAQTAVKAEFIRPVVRRQSARFKDIVVNHVQSLDEQDATMPSKNILPGNLVTGEGSTTNVLAVDEGTKSYSELIHASHELGGSSQCRPSRTAAKKVQSYKEVPLNVKMRRPA